MTHTPEPDQPPVQTWEQICKAIADFYVSRITTDEIREISFAFKHDIDTRLFVDNAHPTPAEEKENNHDNNTQS